MKKKLLSTFLISTLCICMTACGTTKVNEIAVDNTEAPVVSENIVSNNDIESIPTTVAEEYTNAIHEQFKDISINNGSFTITAYLSESNNSYTDENKIMYLQHSPGITHVDDIYYLDAWVYNNEIYYFDKVQNMWCKSEYASENSGEENEVFETFESLQSQSFPSTSNIESTELNGETFIAVSYTDEDGVLSTYYFDDNKKFVCASSVAENNSYIYVTIDTNTVTLPTEVKNATEGNYEQYILDLYQSIYTENPSNNIEEN